MSNAGTRLLIKLLHACPKSVSSTSGGKGIFPVAAYFGPEAGQHKGRNLAASEAMDGEASEAEGMSLFRSVACFMTNRKIENAVLLLNPLNELDVKHGFQRFWTVMKLLLEPYGHDLHGGVFTSRG